MMLYTVNNQLQPAGYHPGWQFYLWYIPLISSIWIVTLGLSRLTGLLGPIYAFNKDEEVF